VAPASQDVFERFSSKLAALGYTQPDVFRLYDTNRTGELTSAQVRNASQNDASLLHDKHTT
jgi:hypothetical protein